ncbi:MAG: LPS assembly protein LptD [Nitrospinota bacterium]|nr:LPS assembly protein LptD [Nitrospinota bacterium]
MTIKSIIRIGSAGILLILLFPQYSLAAGKEAPTYISAKEIEYVKESDIVVAKGEVEIHHKEEIIMGDFARIDNKTGEGLVTGNVLLVDEGKYIVADRANFNTKEDKWIVYDGNGIVSSIYHIDGEEIEKVTEDRFRLKNGGLTTCCSKNAPWRIDTSSTNMQVEGYAQLYNPRLKVRDVPIFYLPYLIVPVKTKRQTGLLRPSFSGGGEDGHILGNTLFWAISDSQDATIAWQKNFLRGDRFDTEYRYILSRDGRGTLNWSYYEDTDPKTDAETTYWKALYRHDQNLPGNTKGVIHIDQVSKTNLIDRKFEYYDLEAKTRNNTDSYMSLSKNWGGVRNLYALARRQESINSGTEETIDEMPSFTFSNMEEQLYSSPLYFSLESSAKTFERKTEDSAGTKAAFRVTRTDIYPKLSLPTPVFPWLSLTPTAAVRQTYYDNGNSGGAFDRKFYELGVEASGPKFYRIFKSGDSAVKHLVEPKVAYTHSSSVSSDIKNQVAYNFDAIDALGSTDQPANKVTYSLTNTLLNKIGKGVAYEVAKLKMEQSYDLEEAKSEDTADNPRRPFSDVETTLTTKIIPPLTFNYTNSYDVYDHITQKESYLFDLDFPGRGYLALERRLERVEANNHVTGEPSNITDIVSLGLKLDNSWKFETGTLYDELNSSVLENDYALTYTAQCWEVTYQLVNRRIDYSDPNSETDNRFFIVFTLKGIGDSGEMQKLPFLKDRLVRKRDRNSLINW